MRAGIVITAILLSACVGKASSEFIDSPTIALTQASNSGNEEYFDSELCFKVELPPGWTADGIRGGFAAFWLSKLWDIRITNVWLDNGLTLHRALENVNQGALGPYVEEVSDFTLDNQPALWVTFSQDAEFQYVVLVIAPDCGSGEHALFISSSGGNRDSFEEFLNLLHFTGSNQ